MNTMDEVDILLVEDNPDDRDMALHALGKVNAASHVLTARDGVEALDYLFCRKEHAGRNIGEAPKVVLLDMKLPRLDGLEVLRAIKADDRTRDIPVVMLTSAKEQNDIVESYQLGVNSYIVKPVDFGRFAEAVQKLGTYWLVLNQSPRPEE